MISIAILVSAVFIAYAISPIAVGGVLLVAYSVLVKPIINFFGWLLSYPKRAWYWLKSRFVRRPKTV